MLDDLKVIHQRDAQDALGIAEKSWQQYLQAFGFRWQPPRPVYDVVVAGMGGSGLAAKASKVWPGVQVPFEVVQGYELPSFVHQNTLVIVSSYSGNTEETVACLEQVLQDYNAEHSPMVVVLASGGRLAELATQHALPLVTLPGGYQPRMTFGFQLRALCEILEQAQLLKGAVADLEAAANWLGEQVAQWLPTVPTSSNFAKQLALECVGKSPVIYAGPLLAPAAYKWKINCNENAKNVAWWGVLPEFNHNELLGWVAQPVDKPYTVIELRSSLEHPRVQKRFEVTERLLSGQRPAPHVVTVQGETVVQQLLWAVTLGDFMSIYLALLNGLNPTPVDGVEKFKELMDS